MTTSDTWATPPRGIHKGWRYKVALWPHTDSDRLTLDREYRRTIQRAIADRIRRMRDFDPEAVHTGYSGDASYELGKIEEELRDAEDVDHLYACINALYDWADAHRVWIEPYNTQENR